mmetsp:Transcript_17153/g.19820  ORF Transcript_17153/g.19820 Transcript_17153/m.19820 type:complete len:237 (-) Transcript_17153:38-748(-)
MVKHNNALPNVHLRKHWGRFVRTWFDQPAKKQKRYLARKSKAKKVFPSPISKLRPVVAGQTRKYNGMLRYGKGFSLAELKAVGLTARFARTVGIATDHRRTNANKEAFDRNVDRLKDYKSKLVLFPLKEGKHKKGLIPDSTAEQVADKAAQVQNRNKNVLSMPPKDTGVDTVVLTEELTKHRAFQQIRQAQVDHKYSRKRYRMQKFKEAVEKAVAKGEEPPKSKRSIKRAQNKNQK